MTDRAAQTVDAIRQLESEDRRQRQAAREALAAQGGAAVWHLIQAARPCGARTRHAALGLLAAGPHPQAEETFVELLDDPDPECRWRAADGLAALGTRGLVRALRLLVEMPGGPELRHGLEHTLRAFTRGEHATTVQPVLHALHEPSAATRAATAAHEALESLRRQGLVQALADGR